MTSWRIMEGDCRNSMRTLEPGSVQTCVTSPPYFGLRDYGTGEWEGGEPGCDHIAPLKGGPHTASTLGPNRDGLGPDNAAWAASKREHQFRDLCGKCGARRVDRQIGLEPTPDEFVAALVDVFREVRRVLRDDGTVWLNLGDSYAAGGGLRSLGRNDAGRNLTGGGGNREGSGNPGKQGVHFASDGCKAKDLLGVPWMVAFALRADGWYLRSDIIWAKPNPMPESVTDRPTKAHEYLFLLSKGPRYFYDADAIAEPSEDRDAEVRAAKICNEHSSPQLSGRGGFGGAMRNRRSVWTVATQPFPGAHFATFPPKLIEPCILAGSREGDVVLDPFSGSGTTGMVALRHDRSYIGCELSPEYAQLSRHRIVDDAPLLNSYSEEAA